LTDVGASNQWITKVRTLLFLAAMVPVLVGVLLLVLFSLVLASPLMIYAGIRGKHLKDPRRKADNFDPWG
jgi:hypothetical protein